MKRTWRCYNPACADVEGIPGHDFDVEAGKAKCDRCGIAEDDPRYGGKLVALAVIHWEAPSVVEGMGVGYPACAPNATAAQAGRVHRTGSPKAVTCHACKETPAFQEALAASKLSADDALHLMQVSIDTRKATLSVDEDASGKVLEKLAETATSYQKMPTFGKPHGLPGQPAK